MRRRFKFGTTRVWWLIVTVTRLLALRKTPTELVPNEMWSFAETGDKGGLLAPLRFSRRVLSTGWTSQPDLRRTGPRPGSDLVRPATLQQPTPLLKTLSLRLLR